MLSKSSISFLKSSLIDRLTLAHLDSELLEDFWMHQWHGWKYQAQMFALMQNPNPCWICSTHSSRPLLSPPPCAHEHFLLLPSLRYAGGSWWKCPKAQGGTHKWYRSQQQRRRPVAQQNDEENDKSEEAEGMGWEHVTKYIIHRYPVHFSPIPEPRHGGLLPTLADTLTTSVRAT